jgi:hypothetical protein
MNSHRGKAAEDLSEKHPCGSGCEGGGCVNRYTMEILGLLLPVGMFVLTICLVCGRVRCLDKSMEFRDEKRNKKGSAP